MKKDFMFTSESVTDGHPDKICDQISDAVVDHFLAQDPYARVRAECAVSTSILFIAARFASEVKADIPTLARKVISGLGYRRPDFDPQTCSVLTSFQEYPPAADLYFNEGKLTDEEIERIPVRQQATMFGFACRQTEVLMPLPIYLAHKLSRRIIQVQKDKTLPYLSPDAKVQVGVEYRNRQPHRIHSLTLVVSGSKAVAYQLSPQKVHEDMLEAVIRPAFAEEAIRPDEKTLVSINPIENLMVGGPAVHSGLTGRKNDVDTYGDYARQTANALSGKDPLRIDRVGVYAARYAAKNVVAAGLAEECEVQLSYSLGFSRPVSVQVETFGTGKLADDDLAALVERHFDFRLAGILKQFNLRHLPALNKGKFYQKLAAYGHVGRRDLNLPWEALDKVGVLQEEK
jgi:S-adenosylmethionine synthetase